MRATDIKITSNKNNENEPIKMLSTEEFVQFHNNRWFELPLEIKEKAKICINEILTIESKVNIIEAYEKDPVYWISPYHFGWGMTMRNHLREYVCTDDQLLSGNWDDYYTQCVEYAPDLRPLHAKVDTYV